MTDTDVIQWFFDCEAITKGFNWPVHVDALTSGKRALDAAITSKAPADDVLAAYQKFAGSIGPTVMNLMLESDDAFPEVNHSEQPTPPSPGKVTLYVDPKGKRVLAECTKEWGVSPKFTIE
jgi:hypothetical protein